VYTKVAVSILRELWEMEHADVVFGASCAATLRPREGASVQVPPWPSLQKLLGGLGHGSGVCAASSSAWRRSTARVVMCCVIAPTAPTATSSSIGDDIAKVLP
jgi:hypothetical protein